MSFCTKIVLLGLRSKWQFEEKLRRFADLFARRLPRLACFYAKNCIVH